MGLSVTSWADAPGPVSLSFDQILLEGGEILSGRSRPGIEKPPSRLPPRQDLDRIMGYPMSLGLTCIAILPLSKGHTAEPLPTILSRSYRGFFPLSISIHDAYRR